MHPYMPYGHKERLSYMPNSLKKSSGSARAFFFSCLRFKALGLGFRIENNANPKPWILHTEQKS